MEKVASLFNQPVLAGIDVNHFFFLHVSVKLLPMSANLPRRLILPLLRFRTMCHTLPVVAGRQLSLERCQRKCLLCHRNLPGDEYHIIFECPAVAHIRQQHQSLFHPGQSMKDFQWSNTVHDLSKCIGLLLKYHTDNSVIS